MTDVTGDVIRAAKVMPFCSTAMRFGAVSDGLPILIDPATEGSGADELKVTVLAMQIPVIHSCSAGTLLSEMECDCSEAVKVSVERDRFLTQSYRFAACRADARVREAFHLLCAMCCDAINDRMLARHEFATTRTDREVLGKPGPTDVMPEPNGRTITRRWFRIERRMLDNPRRTATTLAFHHRNDPPRTTWSGLSSTTDHEVADFRRTPRPCNSERLKTPMTPQRRLDQTLVITRHVNAPLLLAITGRLLPA
ncbi:hypothetical protein [Mycobacteroides abscessus]|uniref:hypothetical protein n=1 Tax=Mycobacteroides abscessus TaxID=36809 RepID=UPI00130011D4|nr:hypothetical protein [Mycobacteroides abscessus]